MKKNIIKSLLSLILSVSMLLTGLGLTVHASVNGDLGEQTETGVSSETAAPTKGEFGEKGAEIDIPTDFKGSGEDYGVFAEENQIALTEFKLTIVNKDYTEVEIYNNYNDELDVKQINAAKISYTFAIPEGLTINAGYTYTIDLPVFFDKSQDTSSHPEPITVGDDAVVIGAFVIQNGKVFITFNKHANEHDDQKINVFISGKFDTEIFKGVEEVKIEVPYSDETSFSATIRPKKDAYVGADSKKPGLGYIYNDQNEKEYVEKNPTHVDWTVRVNDNAKEHTGVKVVDTLGEGLVLVADSFVVEKIIRDYQNNETKVPATNYTVTPDASGSRFTLEFVGDSIKHAYDITYTTELTKPEAGSQREFKNAAKIIYDGNEDGTDVSEEFTGAWSETIPAIEKSGATTDDPHVIDWTVKYNFGKENLGTVTLTDTLSTGHGELISGTLLVYEVNTDIDGNIVGGLGEPIDDYDLDINIVGGTFSIKNLDAASKAYYITFSTTVPVGLNETITNTISDGDGEEANKASDTVTVNTIPTGGKVGEQLVNNEGNPYIEWTITMNKENINVGSITIADLFDQTLLDFSLEKILKGKYLLELRYVHDDGQETQEARGTEPEYKYDVVSSDYSIAPYTPTDTTDTRSGFKLTINNAGNKTYKFVYRTYYTLKGMQEPELANKAELKFWTENDGSGSGIGDGKTFTAKITGPKAGITKSGDYVYGKDDNGNDDKKKQYIQWSIVINESRIEFTNLSVKDALTSDNKANFTYDQNSFVVEDISDAASLKTLTLDKDYTLTFNSNSNPNSFEIIFNNYNELSQTGVLPSNAKFRISYLTTVDDITNQKHENEASLIWQGGTETKGDTVPERTSGIEKAANIEIDENGSKIINWTIDFNSKENVLKDVKLTDTYSSVGTKPGISSIKLHKLVGTSYVEQPLAEAAVTFNDTEGTFTVDIGNIDAVPYRLTYITTLSATQEQSAVVSNLAKITYTGNTDGETDSKEIPKPELVIDKNATGLEKPNEENNLIKPVISWKIKVNTGNDSDNTNNIVNLQNAVLKDIIPEDQSLLERTISVSREGDVDFKLDEDNISSTPNSITIKLPDGAYEYVVTFQTEITEYPAFSYAYSHEIEALGFDPAKDPKKLDRYFNYVELTNTIGDGDDAIETKAKDDAHQDYFADGTNNNNSKTAAVNEDTENIDWTATVNPLGLTIKNPVITDTLSKNQYYLEDSVVVKAGEATLTPSTDTVPGAYTLTFGVTEQKEPTFTIKFKGENNLEELIDKPITVSYSTRLNPDMIGNITVSNKLKLTGGEAGKELSEVTKSTTTSQWTYGGGGSGRTLTFVLNKKNPGGTGIPGAVFNFERFNTAGTVADSIDVTTDNSGSHTFSNARAGRYKATEISTPQGYVKLTEPIYLIVGYTSVDNVFEIKITDSSWAEATSNVASSDGNILTIENQHKAINFALEAKKTLEGNKELTAGLFSFELYKVLPEGPDPAFELLQTKKNAAPEAGEEAGKIKFDAIPYNMPGEYMYQIREKLNHLNDTSYLENDKSHGVTFAETVHDVTVTVTADDAGNLTATASYGETVPAFVNRYLAAPVSVELKASKTLEGQDLKPEQFSFELTQLLDDGEEKFIETVSNTVDLNGVGQIVFGQIEFTKIGTYTYIIREVKGSQGGIDWDASVYTVTVVITDDGEGHLHAKVIYPKPDITITGGAGNTSDYITIDGTPPVFSNKYAAADGTINLFARKTLKGQSLREGQFEFELRNDDDVLLETVSNDASGNVVFSALTYKDNDGEGEHRYTIHEVKGSQGGVTYDETIFDVTVTVVDNKNGELIVTPVYMKRSANSPDDDPIEVEVAVFENSYSARSTSAGIEARKTLDGMTLAADQFEFELIDKATGEVIDTAKNKADGSISFRVLNYGGTGSRTYEYVIREIQGELGGISYDSKSHEVKVHITDDRAGNLSAKVEYPDETRPVFTNTYKAAATSAAVTAHKTLTGKTLTANQFSFELVDKDGKVLETVKNKADGSISFTALNFDTAGENSYTIREVKGKETGIIYDRTEYKVTVKVTDDQEGRLKAEVVYAQGKAPTFTNIFSTEDTGSQIPTEPDDGSEPDLPHTGEGRSTSALGLALILAGLALGLFAWLQQRPRRRYNGR